ncbi:MAG: gliding motility-associated C-terminal domain-containing protein, partial [Bacteroidota bacterium]
SGVREWKLKEITVTPTVDIYAIAIGPNCVEVPAEVSLYYFFDNLVLAETKQFDYKITASAHTCSGNVNLDFPDRDTLQYQWYLDGVALPGETQHNLQSIQQEGNYQVRVLGPHSCRISKPFEFKIPVYHGSTRQVICKDETYFFHQENLSQAGTYFDTLKNWQGCDSIVKLELELSAEMTDTVFAKIFESESWKVGSHDFSKPGEYDVTLTSWIGCDSLVHLILEKYGVYVPNAFSPNLDGINDVFTVFGGDDLEEIVRLKIFDRWGGLVFDASDLKNEGSFGGWNGWRKGKPAMPGVYVYQAKIVLDDGKEREIMGEVTLMK